MLCVNQVFKHVLIMHDGQNLFSDALAAFGVAWKIQDTLDQQIIEGNMEEVCTELTHCLWKTEQTHPLLRLL